MRKIGAGINDEKYLEIYRDINGHRGEMGPKEFAAAHIVAGKYPANIHTYIASSCRRRKSPCERPR